MNNITISGNLTKDCELNFYNNDKPIIKFSFAWNQFKKDEFGNNNPIGHFFNVTWFPYKADIAEDLRKGAKVVINGELRQNKYTDKDGNQKSTIEILAKEVNLCQKTNAETLSQAETSQESTNNQNDADVPF